jgi:acyl carrier protein
LTSEAVYNADVELFKKHFPSHTVLVNALSSSETGPLTKLLIDHESKISEAVVPLGYPLEDKKILVLDELGRDVGFNEVGEIAVRSCYLSSGYWGRPGLNDAKFKRDSKSGESCLYLTGDLGLRLPDGCLIYKGRKDQRVKIRGYGVEIAEVEKVLRDYAGIKEAVVTVGEGPTGDTRLVAYYVATGDVRPGISAIRDFLITQLPEYMIPSVFVVLDALPLTASGKLDRKALATPKNARPALDSPCIAPQTSVEQKLVDIWTEVLGLDQVGIHDNFFELGGHSLAAGRIISRVVRTFGLELPIGSLFDSPTVAEMAAVITESQGNKAEDEALARILAEVEGLNREDVQRLFVEEEREK